MERIRRGLIYYWPIIVAVSFVLFNVGYTISRLEAKPDREEVKRNIEEAIEQRRREVKENYVRIDQVPGLLEILGSMNKSLEDIKVRMIRIEDKIYK